MKQWFLTGVLGAGCIAVAAVGFLVTMGKDHTAPVITIEKTQKIHYTEGEAYDRLLKGVKADDNRDGDLSNQIFVDKIIPVSKKKAVVYYGVMDHANNVGTAKRTVSYTAANADAEENVAADENTASNTDEVVQENTDDKKTDTEEQTDTEKNTQDNPLQADGEKPVIALAEQTKTIARGTAFNPLGEVTDAVDDKDDRDTLFKGLHIDGEYNVNKAGTYTLQYYVQDSDGNTSDPITFTLTVQ